MNHFFKHILSRNRPCIFVSPHLDDAILSCGNAIISLKDHVHVSVVTIFTESGECPESLSAKEFLKQCGISDSKKLFLERRREDEKVFRKLNVSWKHLGFSDALWRKRSTNGKLRSYLGSFLPELLHTYPTYRFHVSSGQISKQDLSLMCLAENAIELFVQGHNNAILFFPLGIGSHVDHVIAREIGARFSGDIVFYEDFPYCLTDSFSGHLLRQRGLIKVTYAENLKAKQPFVAMYATQPLFSGEMPAVPEVYYVPDKLLI